MLMQTMKKALFPLLMAAIVLGGSQCKSNTASTDDAMMGSDDMKVIEIGTMSPLSGDAAAFGEQIQRVYSHYLPVINEKAKEQNVEFKLIHEDSKCSGNDAVSAYQKLKDIDGVKIMLAGFCSSETLAIAPLTKSGEVLTVSPGSSNPSIEGASPYSYTMSYSDAVVATTLAEKISEKTKVAIITEQNDFNIGIRDAFVDALGGYDGVEIVANEVFPKGASDFRVLLEKVKNAGPDAILLNPNPGVTANNLIKQFGEIQDWEGYQLYGQFAYTAAETIAVAPEVLEGMIIVDSPQLTDEAFLAEKAEIEEAQGSLADLGNYYTASVMDAMDIVTDLILELGEDPKAVRDALAERTFQARIGEINFGDSNFPGIGGGVYIIKDGVPEYQAN